MTRDEMAKAIDHTLLAAYTTEDQVRHLCQEAKENGFYSVCINPSLVGVAVQELESSPVRVCAVLGFPLGALPTEWKVKEAQWLLAHGVDEIDMVMNIGIFKGRKFDLVEGELKAVKALMPHKVLKVIIETCYLDASEIKKATELVRISGADFVKTSTGFGSEGACEEDLIIMIKEAQDSTLRVKASGGVRSQAQFLKYLAMGVSRIGTSSGIALMNGLEGSS